jgi:predicted metalloprotease with PDZ domain
LGTLACTGARVTSPVAPPPSRLCEPAKATGSEEPSPTSKLPTIRIVLRPEPGENPRVHVDLHAQGGAPGGLRLVSGTVEDIGHLTVEDAQGALAVSLASAPPGVTVTFQRPPTGPLHVTYDVRATANPNANTSDVVVAEDRFRSVGERLVLIPSGMENEKANVTVNIDTKAIVAPRFASSLGLGQRTREGHGRSLVLSAFLAGSLGDAAFDEGIDHDETVWMGYTAFDPRPAAAEIATVRSALREMWRGGGELEFTLLIVSSPRPVGAYALVPRASSLLVHLGPSEPWSAALRVAVTQHLMRSWIGGELRFAPEEGASAAEGTWFTEGVLRYFAGRALRRLGLISVDDARDFVNGLSSVQATSPHRGKSHAAVAALVATHPVARAHLMSRGALYAMRLAATLRARKKGERTFEDVVFKLLQKARETRAPLPIAAWTQTMVEEVGAEEKMQFDRFLAGQDVVLPAAALGPCFRGSMGQYTAFDLGFDLQETVDSPTRAIARLDAAGPAATAGLLPTDVLEDVTLRHGHAETPVVLSIKRSGGKAEIKYLPRGPLGRGVVYTRKPGAPELSCGDVL